MTKGASVDQCRGSQFRGLDLLEKYSKFADTHYSLPVTSQMPFGRTLLLGENEWNPKAKAN